MAYCQYCGREFGNPGAKTNHENSCDQNPDNTEGTELETTERSRTGLPAEEADELQRVGDGVGQIVEAGVFGSEEEQDEALAAGVEVVSGAVKSLGSSFLDRRREKRERKRASKEDDAELEKVEDYQTCPECGSQLTEEYDPVEEFECSDCGAILRASNSD